MASKPALTFEDSYRSGLEGQVADQLKRAGIEFDYETLIVPYNVPARVGKYKADFPIRRTNIILEPKGHFGGKAPPGGRFSNMKENSAKQRQKFALLKEQHPELDIRFVFTRAKTPIYKDSPTTHGQWATDHGFKWCEKVVPQEWLDEIKQQQKDAATCRQSTPRSASSQARKKSSRICIAGAASATWKRKSATGSRALRRRSTSSARRATRSART